MLVVRDDMRGEASQGRDLYAALYSTVQSERTEKYLGTSRNHSRKSSR